MNPQEFEKALKIKQDQLRHYVNNIFPNRAGQTALRFINGNFRAQGWQGKTFEPWKANKRNGSILIKTGRGRRGTQFSTAPGVVRVFNNVGYMAVHNRGFNGTVIIPAHQRRILGRKSVVSGKITAAGKQRLKTVSTVSGVINVKQHKRKMNIPRRQFMPESWNDSPVLANALKRDMIRSLKKIFS